MTSRTAAKQTRPDNQGSRDLGRLLRIGHGLLDEGDLDEAERVFQRVLESTRKPADALNGLASAAILCGRFDHAAGLCRQALEAAPHHFEARRNLVSALAWESRRLAETGRLNHAAALLAEAREQAGPRQLADATCRLAFGHAYGILGLQCRDLRNDMRAMIAALREARRFLREDAELRLHLAEALVATGLPAMLGDYTEDLTEDELGTHLLITGFPGNGSAFLTAVLAALTRFSQQPVAFSDREIDTELYLPDLVHAAGRDTVSRIHLGADDSTIHLLQGFAIRPVILVRNIFDVLLSDKEFHDTGARRLGFYDRYLELDDDQRLSLVVDDRAARYLAVFAGWQRAMRSGRIDGMLLRHEELMADTAGKIAEIMTFFAIDQSRDRIAAAIDQVRASDTASRLDDGHSGNGVGRFTDPQKAQIRRIAAYHPDIDFSPIGL